MTEAKDRELSGLRGQLDGVDAEIVRLIARRLELVDSIVLAKSRGTEGIRDAEREREVLDRVEVAAHELGISAPLARKIFSEIISHSLARQAAFLSGAAPHGARGVRVAFQGVAHSNSYLAAQK